MTVGIEGDDDYNVFVRATHTLTRLSTCFLKRRIKC